MHIPVLLEEVLEYLDPKPGEFIIDGTVGNGGHTKAILERIGPTGRLLGLDLDSKNVENLKSDIPSITYNLSPTTLLQGNYANLPEILQKKKLGKANGLLLDLGFSSEQMDTGGRGFSFKESAQDEPLLMTYDLNEEPVRDILRTRREEELADIIYAFGEERRSRQIAKAIKTYLRKKPIETAGDLAHVVSSALGAGYEHGRIHPATRTFQALRIYANHELENLEALLKELPEILKTSGRAVIISFHSLEDALVKNAFRDMAKRGIAEMLTKKPITPSRTEISSNPRSRSAKLRAIKII